MTLEQVLKKEQKYKNRFFILMYILLGLLPLVLYLSGIRTLNIICFLIILEVLIILAIIMKKNYFTLDFEYLNNRIRFKSGIFNKPCSIICDKVAIVHTVKYDEDIELIIVTSMRVKHKSSKSIGNNFIKLYPQAAHEYLRLKKLYPENIYYYQVVKNGAIRKYLLLETLFKYCVRSVFTEDAIDNIKISRGQSEF